MAAARAAGATAAAAAAAVAAALLAWWTALERWTSAGIAPAGLPQDVAGLFASTAGDALRVVLADWLASGEEPLVWLRASKVLRVALLGRELTLLTSLGDFDSEQHVLRELFEDVYGLLQFRVGKDGLILDVGGHIGATAILLKGLNPQARVVSFEPVPPNRFFFCMNLALNSLPGGSKGVEIRREAIGFDASSRPRLIYNSMGTAGASEFRPPKGPRSEDLIFEVPATTLEAVLRELGASSVDFMKLDCEGCEFAVGASDEGLLDRIRLVAGEVHPTVLQGFPDREMAQRAVAAMKRRGWKMRKLEKLVWLDHAELAK